MTIMQFPAPEMRSPLAASRSAHPLSPPGDFPRTAATLRQILIGDGRCRRRWLRHARRSGPELPNQAGVAWVLALALWESGDAPESQRTLPRSLKDRVSRALTGRLVSASTLALFVDAFELSEAQERELYTAWEADCSTP